MSYFKTKKGSVEEAISGVSKHIADSTYQDKFKKELDKAGKGIASMSDQEKKAFFDKIDKSHKAKNESVKKEGGPGSGPQDGDKRGQYDTKGHTTDKPKGFFAKLAKKYIDKSNKAYADRELEKAKRQKYGAIGALDMGEETELQETDVKFIYDRNPDKFQKILDKHNKASTRFPNPGPLKNKASPGLKGLWILGGDSVDILDFMKSLNKVGIEPKTKILKAGYGEEKTYKDFVNEGTYHIRVDVDGAVDSRSARQVEKDLKRKGMKDADVDVSHKGHDYLQVKTYRSEKDTKKALMGVGVEVQESVQEADLTDKQVDMVKKVADKLPMKDFKKRYGKDAENVKFGTATNIVKKKLNIDHKEGARNLVSKILKDINSKDGEK